MWWRNEKGGVLMKYANSLLKRNCYEELSTLFGHTANPIKEITESYGAFHHVANAVYKDGLKLDDFFNLHIGDGSTARTGALFTFMGKSVNVSIDPQTNLKFMNNWMERYDVVDFNAYKSTWQDYEKNMSAMDSWYAMGTQKKKHLAIVLVHSHVHTMEVMKAFPNWKYVYTNPCCMPNHQLLSTQQLEQNNISIVTCGHDVQILSPQNQVVVYRNDTLFKGK
jgi:hypothetical protein